MALTNKEIIAHEILLHGITEPINTFASWKAQGYHIKKGSKALFTTQIWKPCMMTVKNNDTTEKQKN